MSKIKYIVLIVIFIFTGALLYRPSIIVNLYYKVKTIKKISISNIIIKPRNDFVIISDSNPIIIAVKNKGIMLDITETDGTGTIELYKNNFNFMKLETNVTKYNVGNKLVDAIEVINKLNKRQVLIVLGPKVVLTLTIENNENYIRNLDDIKEFLITNILWNGKNS